MSTFKNRGGDVHYFLTATAAATFFSIYQVLIKKAGLNWWAVCLLMNGATFLVALAAASIVYFTRPQVGFSQFLFRPDALSTSSPLIISGILMGILAGIENGAGHLFYQQLVATPLKDLSNLTIVIPMLCLIVGFVVAVLFNAEKLTGNKVGAIVAAGLAIWLASRSA